MTTAPGFPDPAPPRWPIVGGATRRGGPAHPCTYFDPLFEGLPVAVAVVDTSDRVLRVNPAFCRMFGYAPDELTGRTLADLIVPDWLRHEAAVQARNAVHGAAAEVETVRRRADGSLLDVAMRRIAVEADGEVIALYGVYQDISDRKRSEAERHEWLERERQDSAPVPDRARHHGVLAGATALLQEDDAVEVLLGRLARFLVPTVADSCIVYLRDPGGEVRRLHVAFADTDQETLMREQLQHYPPVLARLIPPVARTLHTGESQLVPEVSIGSLKAVPGDTGHVSVALLVGLNSLLVVPLVVDGTVLGALSLGTADSGRRFHSDDLRLMEAIAHRAAHLLAPRIGERLQQDAG